MTPPLFLPASLALHASTTLVLAFLRLSSLPQYGPLDGPRLAQFRLAAAHTSLQTLQTRRPRGARAHITLFGAFDPNQALASPGSRLRPGIIEDPYYGGRDGFEIAYDQCVRYARGFLDFLEAGGGEPPKL